LGKKHAFERHKGDLKDEECKRCIAGEDQNEVGKGRVGVPPEDKCIYSHGYSGEMSNLTKELVEI